MARISFALLLLAAALAQATILPAAVPVGLRPNLVLVLLLVWAALRGTVEGLIWVFAVGLLLDTLALDPLGTNGLALLPVALAAGVARRRFFRSGLVFPIVLAALVTVAHGLVLAVLRRLDGGASLAAVPPLAVAPLLLLEALLNAVLVPPLSLVAGWMDGLAPEKA